MSDDSPKVKTCQLLKYDTSIHGVLTESKLINMSQ